MLSHILTPPFTSFKEKQNKFHAGTWYPVLKHWYRYVGTKNVLAFGSGFRSVYQGGSVTQLVTLPVHAVFTTMSEGKYFGSESLLIGILSQDLFGIPDPETSKFRIQTSKMFYNRICLLKEN
jgi:hypothetical protein